VEAVVADAAGCGWSGCAAHPSSPSGRDNREEEVVAVYLLLCCGSALLVWMDPTMGIFWEH